MVIKFKKPKLKIVLFFLLALGFYLLHFTLAEAQECPASDYDCQIAQLQKEINALSPAQEKNKQDLAEIGRASCRERV